MTDDRPRTDGAGTPGDSTTVLCIGNTLMGDDGVGAAVARALRESAARGCRIIERPNAEMGLIKYFLDGDRIIVVDALDAGVQPGSIFRFTPDQAGITELRSNNIHGMGVGFLVTNARLAGRDPDVTVYGVQVGDVRPIGEVLSPEVSSAVPVVAQMIAEEIGAA